MTLVAVSGKHQHAGREFSEFDQRLRSSWIIDDTEAFEMSPPAGHILDSIQLRRNQFVAFAFCKYIYYHGIQDVDVV